MADKSTKEVLDDHAQRRRALLKNASRVAIAAPAVSLLLAQGVKPVMAQGYAPPTKGPGGNPTEVP